MEISFTTMSDPDRERLREPLRSLSRPSVTLGARLEVNSAVIPEPEALSPITSPGAARPAVMNCFDDATFLSGQVFLHSAKKPEFGKMNSLRLAMFVFL